MLNNDAPKLQVSNHQNHDSATQFAKRMSPRDLFQLVYVSRSAASTRVERQLQFAAIVDVSLRNNPARGITGALALVGHRFVHIVEGARGELTEAYDRILSDTRHDDIRLLRFGPVDRRAFAGWALATPSQMTEGLVLWAADAYEESRDKAEGAATMLVSALALRLPNAA
jgi:hypothetical protein